jgi:uncharacterized DUF497 family protein
MIVWDDAKDRRLVRDRGVSFEEIAELIMKREVLAILKNPARENQKVFVVSLRGYTYCVPFVEDAHGNIALKTVYPSRKLHKQYGGTKGGKEPRSI